MSARAVVAPLLDLPGWRARVASCSRGTICGLLAAAVDAVQRGELSRDDPRVFALVERRFEDLKPIDDGELRLDPHEQWSARVATDDVLWPFLADEAVMEHLEAWSHTHLQTRPELAYAVWALPNELHRVRNGIDSSQRLRAIVERHTGILQAVPFGDELMYRRRQLLGLDDEPVYVSRRAAQRRRRAMAAEEGKPWADGKGRRPGAEGSKAAARRRDFLTVFQELTPEQQQEAVALRSALARRLVLDHARRHAISLATAKRDWQWLRRWLHDRGRLGVYHLNAEQRAKLDRRLGSL
jgi:hypothetical protein